MKLLILSDANSVHTLKWVESLQKHKLNLMIFSLFKPNKDYLIKYKILNVEVKTPNLREKIKTLPYPNISKVKYLYGLKQLNQIIKSYNPEILHAHYASSYGVLAFLSKKPFILSVWGSDIFDFPNRNFFYKWLLKKVIFSAKAICSTSHAMKKEIFHKFNRDDIQIVPFGVDIDLFYPNKDLSKNFVVGTIKSIEEHNGIDCLLDAASIIVNENNKNDIQFLIVGKGSMLDQMRQKATTLNINNHVEFTGMIPYDEIVNYHQKLSLFVAMSTRESFGVAVLEAAACGVPAITSNVGGLPEVNKDKYSGLVINPNDSKALAKLILEFYNNRDYINKLGENARDRVIKKFDWNNNVKQMIDVYNKNL